MRTYLTNAELAARGFAEVIAPGVELELDGRGGLVVSFWQGFYRAGNILDRVDGRRARRRAIATITPAGARFAVCTNPGVKGAIRYGAAASEAEAVAGVLRWARRRFAHVTPALVVEGGR